jgi:small subunit ribosomal protein S1
VGAVTELATRKVFGTTVREKEEMEIGSIIEANVTSMEPYGIWLQAQGERGLLLITDISHKRVSHPSEYAKVGDVLTVTIIRFDLEEW